MTLHLRVAVIALLLLVSARSDAADDVEAPRKPAPVGIKIRPAPPFTRWSLINGNPQLSFGGGSATVEIIELVAIELGGNYFVATPIGPGTELFARAGVSPRILDRRRMNHGWVLQVDVLAGYRYYQRTGSTEYSFNDTSHLFSPSAGFQATYWFGKHVGVNMRLSGGVSVPMAHTISPGPSPGFEDIRRGWEFPFSIDWGLDLGIAVH